jgi:putative FmdB family regulatory protein
MPIYEYQCGKCGHQLEALQQISDPPLTKCPECADEALKKLVSAAGFRLKGTGWYATDFKDKGTKDTSTKATKDKPAEAKTSDSASTSVASSEAKTSAA